MKKSIWASSWNGIKFDELGIKLNFFKKASSDFYLKFYEEIFRRFNSYDDLPNNYQKIKIETAEEITNLINKNDNILAYGCGLGLIEKELSFSTKYKSFDAFDFSKNSSKWLKKAYKVKYISKIDNNKKYDFIYFAQLFYSMNDNEIALLISSLHKNLSINGRILTIDTSLNYQENGEIFNEKLLGRFKRIIKPLYLFLLKKNKNQFWGWLRDNKELQNIFEKNGFILMESYASKNQSFQLFKLNI
jgi:hypothetical protein